MPDEVHSWQARYERERAARRAAERIAEQAISELHVANLALEQKVSLRTAELRDALRRVAGADRAKQAFLRGLAHELSTPLHGIGGLAELLRDSAQSAPDRQRAQKILEGAQRLNRTLRSLLEFSAVSDGELATNPLDTTLGAIGERLGERWRLQAARKGSLLVVDVHPDPDAHVVLDLSRLDQVVDPLVANALEHGSGQVQIELRAGPGSFDASVSDQGEGPDERTREVMFDAFARGRSDGLGLGLTLARTVAEGLGGTLRQDLGRPGTTFVATLPLPD